MHKYCLTLSLFFLSASLQISSSEFLYDPEEFSKTYDLSSTSILSPDGVNLRFLLLEYMNMAHEALQSGSQFTQDDLNYNFLFFFYNLNLIDFKRIYNYDKFDKLLLIIVNLFIKRGVNVNCKTNNLQNALHLLNIGKIAKHTTTCMELNFLLITAGSNINAHDEYGKTAFYYAKDMSNKSVTNLLLKYVAKSYE